MKQKTERKLLSFLLTLAMVVGLMPGMGMTAFAENEVNYLPTSSGEYKLSSDITVSRDNPVELGSGTISIDLAGHTITIESDGGSINRTLFHITSGGVLTIKDSSSGGTGKVTRKGTSSNDSVIWVDGGTLNWEGGSVSDVYTVCGIIDVGNGQFNMTGGSFTRNHLSNGGQGAVRLLSGNSFLRISGTPVITGNDGGNVYVSNGSKIEIIGMLNTGANISVNMQTPGVFTTGYGSYYNTESSASDPWDFFQSDDSENKYILWNDTFDEARLGSKNDYPERKSITYIINYKDETATPKSGYEISTDRISTEESPVSLTTILDGNSPKFYVRKSAGEGTEPGEWMEVTLVSRPSEPTGLTSNNATNANTADGTIAGVDNTMEYSADNGKTWIAVSQNTINGLIPGDYLVRVKATNDAPAGKTAEVTVGSKEIILKGTQKPTAKTNLVYTGSEQTLVNEPAENLPEGAKEIQYALGTKDAATQPYTPSIPTATDAGTYYVWYKVVGDSDHSDSEPACVTATISEKPKETDQTTPATIQLNSNLFVRWKGNNVLVNWGTVPSADSYEVWATYCGTSSFELVTTVQGGNKAKITKLKGKSLNKKRGVKAYVVAKQGGTSLGRTLYGHSASPKHSRTNARKVTVKKNSYSLSVGQTAKIKASTVKAKSSKKLLHNGYYRYASSNPSVATVSSGGRITAVGAGTCDVWVYALNGKSKKIGVTVK